METIMKNHKEINGIYKGSLFGMIGDGFGVTNYFTNALLIFHFLL
jgi:hypothetical protein